MKWMSRSAPDWDDQRAFLAVLETGSLSGAARRLGVAQPTVRHRVEALERALGQALFTRSTNGLVPTELAQRLGAHARAMESASQAFVRAASAAPDRVAGSVRLSAAEMVGVEVLPPILAALRRRHPALAVELSLTNAAEDVLAQEVDIAVRMHRPSQAALVARCIGTVRIGFFAHRRYAERRGLPRSREELAGFDLIGPDRAGPDLRVLAALDPLLGRDAFALRTDSHPAQLAAVRAGLGIGPVHLAIGQCEPDLVRVLPELVLHGFETWVVMHEDLRREARVRAVFEHLVERLTRYVAGEEGAESGEPAGR